MIDSDNIIEQLQQWIEFAKRFSDEEYHAAIDNMMDELGERLAECPYNNRMSSGGCYPGGLIESSLKIAKIAKKQMDALGDDSALSVDDKKSLIRSALFFDLGKVGDLENPYWIPQDSVWHRDNLGEMYTVAPDASRMQIEHRSLMILQHFGIKLNFQEFNAIMLSHSLDFGNNRFYFGSEPLVSILLQNAKRVFETQERIRQKA